jgi:uncharacterized membrane protein YsdA (DUF1294 family)/cold shock CspA family protein
MRKQGKVVRWDPAKGFGFIRSPDTNQEVFFHIKDYRWNTAPREGEAVWFEEIHVGGKGPRGMSVLPVNTLNDPRSYEPGSHKPKHHWRSTKSNSRHVNTNAEPTSAALVLVLFFAWVALVGWGVMQKRLPTWAIGVTVVLNLITLCVYAHDKYAAQHGRWRVREDTLHLLGLLGGWPGAWLAQQAMRHKSSKPAFRATYWGTVTTHFAVLVGWLLWLQPHLLLKS